MKRRHVLAGLAAASVIRPSALGAQEKYPSRPIMLVLAYAAGGGTDTVARTFAAKLEAKLGASIVVENRPGAGGALATDAVAGARADGYTLLIGNQGPMAVNPHLFKSLKSDPEKTLDAICMIADAALVVVVNPKSPVTTLLELVAEAKKRPGELTYASASNGSASHLAAALLGQATGTKSRHVAYRGAAPALNDLVGAHVDFMITTIPSVAGLIEFGLCGRWRSRVRSVHRRCRKFRRPSRPGCRSLWPRRGMASWDPKDCRWLFARLSRMLRWKR